MTMQTGKNVLVAYKVESTFNTAPGDTGGTRLRLNPSPGGNMARPTIEPGEIRSDGLTPMGRLGSRSTGATYGGDVSANSFDDWLEAVMRSTWTAAVAITESEMTSITTPTTSTIVAAGGSWITEGVRVGDIVRLTDHQTAANNNLNLRVTAVSATTITVAGTPLTVDASADTAFTLTILKKLINGSTPTERSFYIEEYYQDIDQSKVLGGSKIVGFVIRGSPDGMATIEFQTIGASQTALATGASPYYTSPTLTTTEGLVFTDAALGLDGTDIAIATSFELSATLGGSTLPVIGSNYTPGVFLDQLRMSGSVSLVRETLDYVTAFDAETEFELNFLLQEPSGTPKKCVAGFVPRIKFTGNDAQLGQDGAMIESLPFMVGLQSAATGYDATMASFCTETA